MAMADVRLTLTMDCERVRESEFYPAGPVSWEESARNIAAFAAIVEEYGCRATFFAVPEAVEAHVELFQRLIAAGHEVGLHLHPHTFRYGVNEYLGNLPYDRQFDIVREARDAFAAALGFPPTSFRPGHFSANADTFRILSSLGFLRGSSVIPGRHLTGTGGDWRNWPRRCQYVGSVFEVPVTVQHVHGGRFVAHAARHALRLASHGFVFDAVRNFVLAVSGGTNGSTKAARLVDLRIESGSYGLTRAVIDAEVTGIRASGLAGMLTAVTHSYVNYAAQDRGTREHGMSRRSHLRRMLADLKRRSDVVVTSRTLSGLQRDFDAGAITA